MLFQRTSVVEDNGVVGLNQPAQNPLRFLQRLHCPVATFPCPPSMVRPRFTAALEILIRSLTGAWLLFPLVLTGVWTAAAVESPLQGGSCFDVPIGGSHHCAFSSFSWVGRIDSWAIVTPCVSAPPTDNSIAMTGAARSSGSPRRKPLNSAAEQSYASCSPPGTC